jgi:hypothetical protein
MNKVYVGMDPGKSGAMAMIYPDGYVEIIGFPIIGKEYDLQEFQKIFLSMKSDTEYKYHIIIEDVKALQGAMKAGNWSLSRGKTILEVMAACFYIPYTLVHSKTWQKEMWQGVPVQLLPIKTATGRKKTDTKAMSLIAAKRLFPNVDLRDPNRKTERSQKIHDGAVDAVLLAEYGRRKF